MRVAIVALGSAGDVHPFVAVGRALRERGHEVAIHASAWYEDALAGTGIRFHGLGTREHDNGSRVVDLGVGRCLDAEKYDAARGAAALHGMLHDRAPPRVPGTAARVSGVRMGRSPPPTRSSRLHAQPKRSVAFRAP